MYERMPLYCYLCGLVGHLEKRCLTRFNDNFVDPGMDYGVWLKTGEVGGNTPLPLQPIPSPARREHSPPMRFEIST